MVAASSRMSFGYATLQLLVLDDTVDVLLFRELRLL